MGICSKHRVLLAAVLVVLASGCPTGGGEGSVVDFDGDGAPDIEDCAPSDPARYPGADDPYGDGDDADCDGADGVDSDGDGYPANLDLGSEFEHLRDCDDGDADVHPTAPDAVGDAIDFNCDGHDGVDLDQDGEASTASGGQDCDDDDPAISPSADEACDDAVDSDCSGDPDDRDQDRDGQTAAACGGPDCDDDDPTVSPAEDEVCGDPGARDEDCSGAFDDRDADGDEAVDGACGGTDCDDGDPLVQPDATELCDGADNDCDGATDEVDLDGDGARPVACGGDDCDDVDPAAHPGAAEFDDGIDNDCDGAVDEGTVRADDDGDGWCEGPAACSDGALPGDCDDTAPDAHPGADEVCGDAAGLDEDCSGRASDRDADGDGAIAASCGGPDCDDTDAAAHPGAVEVCGEPLDADEDCSGAIDDLDGDGDGFVDVACGGLDCDDGDAAVSPAAQEVCDDPSDRDEDCSGLADDRDRDGDGDAHIDCGGSDCDDDDPLTSAAGLEACNDGGGDRDCSGDPDDVDADADGYRAQPCGGDDCDDGDPLAHPGRAELADGLDNDCDGVVDEGTDVYDDDGDGFCEAGPCVDGSAPGDCDDDDDLVGPGMVELCGGVDEDCSGRLDDRDLDGDGFIAPACGGRDCDESRADVHPEADEICGDSLDADEDCSGLIDDADLDGDGELAIPCGGQDCDDLDAGVAPDRTELCEGSTDEDCSGVIDDADLDQDGAIDEACGGTDCDDGDAAVSPASAEACSDLVDGDCSGDPDDVDVDADGHVDIACGGGDCADFDARVHPGHAELLDGLDNDCDGDTDEGTDAFDDDGDGYSELQGDCDDDPANPSSASRHPGALEDGGAGTQLGDGVDNDCDGSVDEGMLDTDDDGDGLTELEGDCDDGAAAINPGGGLVPAGVEACNGADDDCDGETDEIDADGDGFAPIGCSGALPGTDCDDLQAQRFPGNPDLVDGLDNNCDGLVDEGSEFADDDGDCSCENGGRCVERVDCPGGVVPGDCDDGDASRYPSAPEACNGIDDDCDPSTDEDEDQDGDAVGPCSGDCDDGDPGLSPLVTEQCDGTDENCDGVVDDACVACDATVAPGDDVVAAVAAAGPGATVCLLAGHHDVTGLTLGATELDLIGLAGRGVTSLSSTSVALTITGAQPVSVTGLTIAGDDNAPICNPDNIGCYLDAVDTASAILVTGHDAGATLSGLALREGRGTGLVIIGSSNVTLEDVDIIDYQSNGRAFASGMSVVDCPTPDAVVATDLNLFDNSPNGGLRIHNSQVRIEQARFQGNRSQGNNGLFGGIALYEAGHLTLSQAVLAENESPQGAAMFVSRGSSLVADHIVVRDHVGDQTAGIKVFESSVDISYLRSSGNLSLASGHVHGDIRLDGGTTVDIDHATFATGTAYAAIAMYNRAASIEADSVLVANFSGRAFSRSGGETECGCTLVARDSAVWNTDGTGGATAGSSFVTADPMLVDGAAGTRDADLHLGAASSLVDAGPAGELDPDGSPADIGAYAGPGADGWDLDGDGSPQWWQPGPWQPSYAALGYDCDDENPALNAAVGCGS